MPISQKTILAIYGEFCDLVDQVADLDMKATQADLFADDGKALGEIILALGALRREANLAQRRAIAEILADDIKIKINPLDGRIV